MTHKKMLVPIVILSVATFYFTAVGFGFGPLGQVISAFVAFALLYYAGIGGWQRFYLVALSVFTLAPALGCAFLSPGEVTGPFVTAFRMTPLMIMLVSVIVGLAVSYWDSASKSSNRFALILFWVFILNWVVLAFNVRFFDDWKMENWLTVPFIVIIYVTHRWFRLSNVSYGLIFAYMMLHIYGSHYTYSEVPFGFWMQNAFDMARNHYDRIVHFSFGFILAYPIRELTIRISDAKGFWSFWFPIEFVLAFSCVYELLEWLIAILFGGDLGIAYLGTQGDVWDAQKDMFLAGLGSIIAMVIVALIIWYYRKSDFLREFGRSFSVKKKGALGEEALKKMQNPSH